MGAGISSYHLGAASASNMLQGKIDDLFKELPNLSGIADDILILGYDNNGADHDGKLGKALHFCRNDNLKLNKGKCHFRCTSVPPFDKIMGPETRKLEALTDMSPRKLKKKMQAFTGVINYLNNFLPVTGKVC